MHAAKKLLSIIELGGYPNFTTLYQSLGFEVIQEKSVRNAIRTLKHWVPQVIVAEFNFQSDFRDRTSSLESLLSTVQRMEGVQVVVFYEADFVHQLDKLRSQYPLYATLAYPIDTLKLSEVLQASLN
ncbi:MAG: hypothetical protein HY080_04975 [Gammaproteobacteria bacterium]|nr:hypothetical protein [Gammaproteobacteria bacterium]